MMIISFSFSLKLNQFEERTIRVSIVSAEQWWNAIGFFVVAGSSTIHIYAFCVLIVNIRFSFHVWICVMCGFAIVYHNVLTIQWEMNHHPWRSDRRKHCEIVWFCGDQYIFSFKFIDLLRLKVKKKIKIIYILLDDVPTTTIWPGSYQFYGIVHAVQFPTKYHFPISCDVIICLYFYIVICHTPCNTYASNILLIVLTTFAGKFEYIVEILCVVFMLNFEFHHIAKGWTHTHFLHHNYVFHST